MLSYCTPVPPALPPPRVLAPPHLLGAGGPSGEGNRRLRCHVFETDLPPGEPQGDFGG